LHQVVFTSEILTQPEGSDHGEDTEMADMHRALAPPDHAGGSDVVIRYVLDREKVLRKQLTVEDVGKGVQAYLGGDGVVIWSEVNSIQWCVRVRVANTELAHVGVADMTLIHDFLMENVTVNGVHGIKRVIVKNEKKRVCNPTTGALDMQDVCVADTEGSNLAHILTLEGVHASTTFSNDIHETLAVLGIEAATHQLLTEIRCVLSHDGAYVNDRHLQLLVDVMTHNGILSPVTRHNMSRLGASIYTRASFETMQKVLTSGAIMGVKNKTNGVTENIMLGNTISGGTGCCDVIMDKSVMPPPPPRAPVVKALVRENPHVLPLNRMAKTSPVRPINHKPGFVGKKRKGNAFQARECKRKRTLVLESPQMRSGVRQLVLQSP
jgi:DNA-directed RNA polymerase II subunit RPB1